MFGERSPYLPPGHFQVSIGGRNLRSEYPNWIGNKRLRVASGVINKQQIIDLSATYAINRQATMQVSMPFFSGSWSYLYGPIPVPGDQWNNRARATQYAGGLSDMSVVLRSWLLPTWRFRSGNIALGFGLNFPSGAYNKHYTYPDIGNARNNVSKPVDISIQPGGGGLGLIADVQYFKYLQWKPVRDTVLFGYGAYLANPRNTNKTASIIQGLVGPAVALGPNFIAERTNSVPDQYIGTLGLAVPVPVKKLKGFAISGAARVEGVTPVDLIGGNAGFRRPAVVLFAEPGFSYAIGKTVLSMSVPVRAYANVLDSPISPRREEATIANYMILWQVTRRF